MGAYLNENVELRFASAYDSDERQVQQIDSLVKTGIDLLIVAPNQVQTISPAIDRAYDSGIPVIVFERKTSSRKYTSFIGADNYEMGRIMGEYIGAQLHGKGRVMEVMGLKGSSPAIERHKGFADALKNYPGIDLVATLQGDWTEESAVKAVHEHQGDLTDIDFVFGQNDRMAMGARKALLNSLTTDSLTTSFCGIDGLPGEDGGIRLVRDGLLNASYIYPTHGDQIIDLAIQILEGKPYEKETLMMSALITCDNARELYMQGEEIIHQTEYLDLLHDKADNYLHELSTQRTINLLAIGVIVLLLAAIAAFYLYHASRVSLRRERVVHNLWNLDTETISQTQHSPQDPSAAPLDSSQRFISRFKSVVEERLTDSELSIEDLAADMSLSRVQLYRKVKSITGSSPVELLRTARLNRGYQMLLTTDKTVAEVAYAVGFTAPSYFTKCFKEEFGQNPTEMKQ